MSTAATRSSASGCSRRASSGGDGTVEGWDKTVGRAHMVASQFYSSHFSHGLLLYAFWTLTLYFCGKLTFDINAM